MSTKKRKYNKLKQARRSVIGLVCYWSDKTPLNDTRDLFDHGITHRNPVMKTVARDIYQRFCAWIFKQQCFTWNITITVVFSYENGTDQREERVIIARCVLDQINDFCNKQIHDAMRHGDADKYSHTEFVCECVDN